MSYAECIVFAFRSLGEAGQPAIFAIGMELRPAAGKDLMSVCLVAYIPYKLIVGGIKCPMQGHRQLHDAEAGAEVAAVDADYINDVLTQLGCNLGQFLHGEVPKILRGINA